MNLEDGGQRQCISVTNNEVSADESDRLTKEELRPGDPQWEQLGIAHYVAWPRIKHSILGTDINGHPLKGTYDVQEDVKTRFTTEVLNIKTKKPIKRALYVNKKMSLDAALTNKKMKDGFKENAVFFDLNYLEPSAIKANLAFDKIAPLLWMKAGSKGRIIKHKSSYDITNEYAVLFNYKYIGEFSRQLKQNPKVKTIFIITDINSRYQDFCHEFSDRKVYKLYESYLKSFQIQSLN